MKLSCSEIFITIATENVQLSADFYQQLLELKPKISRLPAYVEFEFENLRLAIFKPKADHQAEFVSRTSSMSLCLELEDLDRAIAHLSDLGYPPPGEVIQASHGREIYAYDPDGNRLILHQS